MNAVFSKISGRVAVFFLGITGLPLLAQTVVENGVKPKGNAWTISFTEDLRFGTDEPEDEFLWADDTTDLAVDGDGNFYISDPKVTTIRKFDADGKFVKVIARQGQGPGELMAIKTVEFLADGTLIAFESRPGVPPAFHFFDDQLNYKETVRSNGMSNFPIRADWAPNGKYFSGGALGMDLQAGRMKTYTGIYRKDLTEVKQFTAFEQDVDFQNFVNPAQLSKFLGELLKGYYKASGIFAFDRDNNIYTAINNKYEITKWSPDMSEKLMVIKRKHKPILNTEEDTKAVVNLVAESFKKYGLLNNITDEFLLRVAESADLPPIKPPIFEIYAMPEGHLLVVHNVDSTNGDQLADIFDKNGTYLGQTKVSNWAFSGPDATPRMVFKNGFAYTIETDDLGDNRAVRYRYELKKI